MAVQVLRQHVVKIVRVAASFIIRVPPRRLAAIANRTAREACEWSAGHADGRPSANAPFTRLTDDAAHHFHREHVSRLTGGPFCCSAFSRLGGRTRVGLGIMSALQLQRISTACELTLIQMAPSMIMNPASALPHHHRLVVWCFTFNLALRCAYVRRNFLRAIWVGAVGRSNAFAKHGRQRPAAMSLSGRASFF